MKDSDDIAMYEWNGTIIGPPHSAYENRIFSLSIFCGDNFPGTSFRQTGAGCSLRAPIDVPPLLKFESRITLPCVDQRGLVSHTPHTRSAIFLR